MDYIRRVIDSEIDLKSQAFNAINIIGPKGSGKTRTAKERCKTHIEFQDVEKRPGYLSIAQTSPKLFFKDPKPILFDEWKDAPMVWDALRKECDDNPESFGSYYLTASTSKNVHTAHTGTGRITSTVLYPMTLSESGESNGKISLYQLVTDPSYECDGVRSEINLEELFFAVCRGGWPRCLAVKSDYAKLEIAKDYYQQIFTQDINSIDDVNRNPEWARALLWSYARNMATLAKKTSIYEDVRRNHDVSDITLASYIDALEKLFVIADIDAWTPQIRSRTAIRAAKKHIFVDPSIGLAALGVSPDYFRSDLDLFGHAFENLVIRDLLVYAQVHSGKILHYSDSIGLEVDAIYQLPDGRYALIEIKTGVSAVKKAESDLLKFKDVVRKYNEKALADPKHPKAVYREPSSLIVICANADMSYTTENGVKVIPIGCLRE